MLPVARSFLGRFARSALAAGVFIPFLLSGCKSCDLVEAELRFQEEKLEETEGILVMKEAEIATLRATVDSLRGELKQRGSTAPPEQIYRSIGLAKIEVGALTGPRDFDGDGKDDGLQVQIVCKDFDDDAFKCPGAAAIELYEFAGAGAKNPIGRWDVDQVALKTGYRSSLLGQGYQVVLPWKQAPVEKKLRVVVKFQTIDGREFEAERDLAVSLAAKPGGRPVAPDLLVPVIESAPAEDPIKKTSVWKPTPSDGHSPWWSLPFARSLPEGMNVRAGRREPSDFGRADGSAPPPSRRGKNAGPPVRLMAPEPVR